MRTIFHQWSYLWKIRGVGRSFGGGFAWVPMFANFDARRSPIQSGVLYHFWYVLRIWILEGNAPSFPCVAIGIRMTSRWKRRSVSLHRSSLIELNAHYFSSMVLLVKNQGSRSIVWWRFCMSADVREFWRAAKSNSIWSFIPFLICVAHLNTGGKCSVISMRSHWDSHDI